MVTGRLGISSDGKWRLNSSHFTDVEVAARVREVEFMTDTNYRRSATNSQVPVEVRQRSHLHPTLVAEHLTVPTTAFLER